MSDEVWLVILNPIMKGRGAGLGPVESPTTYAIVPSGEMMNCLAVKFPWPKLNVDVSVSFTGGAHPTQDFGNGGLTLMD